MNSQDFDGKNARDAQFEEVLDRRINAHVRRKPTKRRKGPKNSNSASPGGIRQRKNKRWAW